MVYIYSDLNTFSACVHAGKKRIFVVALELTVTFFCIRSERELKKGISLTGYKSDGL